LTPASISCWQPTHLDGQDRLVSTRARALATLPLHHRCGHRLARYSIQLPPLLATEPSLRSSTVRTFSLTRGIASRMSLSQADVVLLYLICQRVSAAPFDWSRQEDMGERTELSSALHREHARKSGSLASLSHGWVQNTESKAGKASTSRIKSDSCAGDGRMDTWPEHDL
jgi:hypothetical protein